MVVVWVSAFGERKLPIGGWLILRHPNRDSCPEPLFFDLTNQVFLLRSYYTWGGAPYLVKLSYYNTY